MFEVCCSNVGTTDALPINERLTPWSQAASNFTRSKCRESGPLLPGLVRALCQARTARHTETKQGDQTTISFNMFQQVSTTRFRMVQDHSLRLTKFSHSKRRTAVPAGEEEEGCTGLTTSSASSAEKTDQRRPGPILRFRMIKLPSMDHQWTIMNHGPVMTCFREPQDVKIT